MSKKPSPRGNRGPAPLWAGQNFLTGGRVLGEILAHTGIGPGDRVVEIGAGKGHLTRALLARGAQVEAVEADPALCARLREQLGGEQGFTLRQGDFLQMRLPDTGRYQVVGNLPFGQTTAMLRRLTRCPNPPACAWLIVEKGAAMRFSGHPRESRASLALRPFFAVRLVQVVPREAFHPAPGVDAALLCARRRAQPDLPWDQRAAFDQFLQAARERGVESLLTHRQVMAALRDCPERPSPGAVRDGNLRYVQWLCLFRGARHMGLGPGKGR